MATGEPLLLSADLDLGILSFDPGARRYESRLIDRQGRVVFTVGKPETLRGKVFLPMMRTGQSILGNWVNEQDLNSFPPLFGNDYVLRQAMVGDVRGPFAQSLRGLGRIGDQFAAAQIWSPLGVPEDTELTLPSTGLFSVSPQASQRVYVPPRGEAISDAVLISGSHSIVIQVTILKRRGSRWSLEGARTEWRFVRLKPSR